MLEEKEVVVCSWCGNSGGHGPVEWRGLPGGRKPLCINSYDCVKRELEARKGGTLRGP